MKFLFDLFPILLFFVAYKMYDIYVATAVAIVASFVQVGLFWLKHRRFETNHLVTLAIIAILGTATLYLQDERFIKWKPTIVYWFFAAGFLIGQFVGSKPPIERMLGGTITLPRSVWLRLNATWMVFFLAMGVLNIYVMQTFTTNIWVNFKLFGLMGLTLAFMVAQGFYIARHVAPEEEKEEGEG